MMREWGNGLSQFSFRNPVVHRPCDGHLRAQPPAGQVRRDGGALANATAGERSAVGHSRPPRDQLYAIEIPKLGSFIASGTWVSKEVGLEAFPKEDRPPVVIPFFAFRAMVGMGLVMLAVSWFGNFLAGGASWKPRAGSSGVRSCRFQPALWPSSRVGTRQRSDAGQGYLGLLRTKDAVTPSLTAGNVLFSLIVYAGIYVLFVSFGFYYISSCCGKALRCRPHRFPTPRPAGRSRSPPTRPRRPAARCRRGDSRSWSHRTSRCSGPACWRWRSSFT